MGVDFLQCDYCNECVYEEDIHFCCRCEITLCKYCVPENPVNLTDEYVCVECWKDIGEKLGVENRDWLFLDEHYDDVYENPERKHALLELLEGFETRAQKQFAWFKECSKRLSKEISSFFQCGEC